jgi:hypothetical protein
MENNSSENSASARKAQQKHREGEDEDKEEGAFKSNSKTGGFPQQKGQGPTSHNLNRKEGGDSNGKYQQRAEVVMTTRTSFEQKRTPGKLGMIKETTRTSNTANSPSRGANKDKNQEGVQEVQEDNTIIQSQQSVVDFRMGEGGSISDEELIDYDEYPLVAEKLEMREVEKRVEVRATKLVNDSAINIKRSEEEVKGKEEESGEVLLSGSTDDDEEID